MKYQITEKQLREIKQVLGNNTNPRLEKRLIVLILRAEGKKLKEIAAQTDFHVSNVGRLLRLYHTEGLEGFIKSRYSGNRRNMTHAEEAEFLRPFQQKVNAGQSVTPRDIKAAYEEKVGHAIGGSQIYYVLKRHGWRVTWSERGDSCQQEELG